MIEEVELPDSLLLWPLMWVLFLIRETKTNNYKAHRAGAIPQVDIDPSIFFGLHKWIA